MNLYIEGTPPWNGIFRSAFAKSGELEDLLDMFIRGQLGSICLKEYGLPEQVKEGEEKKKRHANEP